MASEGPNRVVQWSLERVLARFTRSSFWPLEKVNTLPHTSMTASKPFTRPCPRLLAALPSSASSAKGARGDRVAPRLP
eukprot:CAMPEP_0171893424 /NCGR_PEP_ID=MMETSP0992-20121227/45873_1 /TAXON_ID=483369 /ORGANISM="non described non described, Strain CCMP2098" /LENGTH=77 /DNA_ID=CAMNT_0012521041 /DNA_START=36 /DNA_END=266 /DNA_ORIENTATION=+